MFMSITLCTSPMVAGIGNEAVFVQMLVNYDHRHDRRESNNKSYVLISYPGSLLNVEQYDERSRDMSMLNLRGAGLRNRTLHLHVMKPGSLILPKI